MAAFNRAAPSAGCSRVAAKLLAGSQTAPTLWQAACARIAAVSFAAAKSPWFSIQTSTPLASVISASVRTESATHSCVEARSAPAWLDVDGDDSARHHVRE